MIAEDSFRLTDPSAWRRAPKAWTEPLADRAEAGTACRTLECRGRVPRAGSPFGICSTCDRARLAWVALGDDAAQLVLRVALTFGRTNAEVADALGIEGEAVRVSHLVGPFRTAARGQSRSSVRQAWVDAAVEAGIEPCDPRVARALREVRGHERASARREAVPGVMLWMLRRDGRLPSHRQIAREAGVSVGLVRAYLHELL